ncbi:hypothetical protein [uncultured Sphingomonas sp.]|uniref:hypothetical protein n=1 Tax=uncultured Sphingomonas sp. TaxID=158754 RepID=UPI0025DA1CE5|nr:hypothetical protein [uncultured Sphingomonas sp.]
MNVFEHFSAYSQLPVSLEDVAAFVIGRTHFVDVIPYPVPFPPEILQGLCWQHIDKPHNSINHHRRAWVLFSDKLTPDMTRMVVCKEILHLLDTVREQAGDRAEVAQLIDEIVQPVELKAAIQTESDNLGMVLALAVLMPASAIDELRPLVEQDTISFDTLSKLAGVPEHYVRHAFKPQWQDALKVIERYFQAGDEVRPAEAKAAEEASAA